MTWGNIGLPPVWFGVNRGGFDPEQSPSLAKSVTGGGIPCHRALGRTVWSSQQSLGHGKSRPRLHARPGARHDAVQHVRPAGQDSGGMATTVARLSIPRHGGEAEVAECQEKSP